MLELSRSRGPKWVGRVRKRLPRSQERLSAFFGAPGARFRHGRITGNLSIDPCAQRPRRVPSPALVIDAANNIFRHEQRPVAMETWRQVETANSNRQDVSRRSHSQHDVSFGAHPSNRHYRSLIDIADWRAASIASGCVPAPRIDPVSLAADWGARTCRRTVISIKHKQAMGTGWAFSTWSLAHAFHFPQTNTLLFQCFLVKQRHLCNDSFCCRSRRIATTVTYPHPQVRRINESGLDDSGHAYF